MSAPAFAWALELGASLGLTPAERLVLIYLADKANGEQVCWPSQPTIARYTGLAPNTVTAAIRRLTARQLIRVESSPGLVARYHIQRLVTPANSGVVAVSNPRKMYATTPANSVVDTPSNGAGVAPEQPPQNVGDHPRNQMAIPTYILPVTPANRGGEPSINQEREPSKEEHPPNPPRAEGGREIPPPGFAEFWDLYPRKVGRRTAAAAFTAAVNRGNHPDAIIAGLRNHKFHADPQFQPHPTTWLRGDRWLDEADDFDPVLRAAGLKPEDFAGRPMSRRLLQ